jgi:thiosulfate reductase cytochrome b subunit
MAPADETIPATETGDAQALPPREAVIHPLYVRITHWINALALSIMILSGWQIYNASPLFAFTFPGSITLGRWLAGALLLHFAAMWVLIANGLVYLVLGLATGRLRRKLLPIRPSEVVRDAAAAFTGRVSRDDLGHYNAAQKALYVGVLLAGVVVVASGFSRAAVAQAPQDLDPRIVRLVGGVSEARLVVLLKKLESFGTRNTLSTTDAAHARPFRPGLFQRAQERDLRGETHDYRDGPRLLGRGWLRERSRPRVPDDPGRLGTQGHLECRRLRKILQRPHDRRVRGGHLECGALPSVLASSGR